MKHLNKLELAGNEHTVVGGKTILKVCGVCVSEGEKLNYLCTKFFNSNNKFFQLQ